MLDPTGGWPVQRRATRPHERLRLRPLPVNRAPRATAAVSGVGDTAPVIDGEHEHATARIIALLEAILSGRCAATLLRSVSTDAGFRQFSRTRHQMADSTDGPVRLRMSSMNRVGDDRLDIMVALSTSGLLAVTVHRVAEGWRLTGCTLLRSPRQPGRGRADDR